MTNSIKILFVSLFTLVFSASAYTDDTTPAFIPLEGYACNFSKGKDMDDLYKVVDKWNDFIDEGGTQYNSWVFTPFYYSEEEAADIYWIGISPTWEEMLKTDEHMAKPEGQKLQAEFNKVSPCYDHTNWGYESVRSGSDSDDDGVVTLMWCDLTEGTTRDQVLAADKKYNAYMESTDSSGGAGRWWPGSGIPTRFTADFLWGTSSDSLADWGRSADMAVNGGGNQAMQSIYGDLMTCSNRAVYTVKAARTSN